MSLGLWLVGAGGNVATTVAVALDQLARGLCDPIGLVTAVPPISRLPV